jgi:hypothetical protein
VSADDASVSNACPKTGVEGDGDAMNSAISGPTARFATIDCCKRSTAGIRGGRPDMELDW